MRQRVRPRVQNFLIRRFCAACEVAFLLFRVAPGPAWIPMPRFDHQLRILPVRYRPPACPQHLLQNRATQKPLGVLLVLFLRHPAVDAQPVDRSPQRPRRTERIHRMRRVHHNILGYRYAHHHENSRCSSPQYPCRHRIGSKTGTRLTTLCLYISRKSQVYKPCAPGTSPPRECQKRRTQPLTRDRESVLEDGWSHGIRTHVQTGAHPVHGVNASTPPGQCPLQRTLSETRLDNRNRPLFPIALRVQNVAALPWRARSGDRCFRCKIDAASRFLSVNDRSPGRSNVPRASRSDVQPAVRANQSPVSHAYGAAVFSRNASIAFR